MKKIILFLGFIALSFSTSAEILKVERVEQKFSLAYMWYDVIYLSNGDNLYFKNSFCALSLVDGEPIGTNFDADDVSEGTLLEKRGNTYNIVSLKKGADKVIKYAKVHQVTREFNASLNGNFSYGTFFSIGAGSGRISGNASGGSKTIVNLVFTDNTSASIEVADDPIWLEAAAGMKVEYYKCGTCNIYKLIFN